jgi:hypothetical protein
MIKLIIYYILSINKPIFAFFSKESIILVPITISLSYFISISNELKGLLLLLFLMLFDFVTGIIASSFRRKKSIKEEKEVSKRLIESAKLKLSGVKFLLYFSTIFIALCFHHIFVLKDFNIWVSTENKGLVLIITGFWCLVELYSILFENFKDMGIDVLRIFDKIKEIYKKIKE